MSRVFAFALFALFVVIIPACSSGDNIPPPTEQELSTDAKRLVLDFVASAKTSPKNVVSDNAVGLQESLDPLTDPALDGVKATVKELTDLFASAASITKIKATMDKLEEQANSL